MGTFTASKIIYELEICIIDKNNREYAMIIPAKFSQNPYKEMQKVEQFFKNKQVNIIVFHNKRKVSDENNQTNCYFFSN